MSTSSKKSRSAASNSRKVVLPNVKTTVPKWQIRKAVREEVKLRNETSRLESAREFVRGCVPEATDEQVEQAARKITKAFAFLDKKPKYEWLSISELIPEGQHGVPQETLDTLIREGWEFEGGAWRREKP